MSAVPDLGSNSVTLIVTHHDQTITTVKTIEHKRALLRIQLKYRVELLRIGLQGPLKAANPGHMYAAWNTPDGVEVREIDVEAAADSLGVARPVITMKLASLFDKPVFEVAAAVTDDPAQELSTVPSHGSGRAVIDGTE